MFAVFGGLVLLAVMVLTVASVAGRGLLSRPLAGDFELVEIGVAVAIFAFLPYAQLVRGHIVVDLFTRGASLRTRAALELAGNLALTGIAGVLTWRLVLGGLDLARFREVTMVLAVPVWWGFVPAGLALALLTAVSA
ncbi:MAG: TRAP transporter small permease, partial [Rhodospirillales bacterium]